MARAFLSGSGGFAGHHLLEHLLANTNWDIVATDSFRHRGKTDRVTQVLNHHPGWWQRVDIITHDLTAPFSEQAVHRIAGNNGLNYLIMMASESHVDRSITDPVPFVRNNVDVALSQLELARQLKPKTVLLVSTDEIYGPVIARDAPHPEWDSVIPSNPYSASKVAQEALAISYWRTYGVPVILTNLMNIYGQRQDTEKFLPTLIKNISEGKTVKIHGKPGDIGTRHYLHARNAASAWLFLLEKTTPSLFPDTLRPDRWNVAGPEPISNLDLALEVASIIGKDLKYELVDFHSARPGHDPHYGLDMTKLTTAGWKPPVEFHESLEHTVLWSLANPEWLQ